VLPSFRWSLPARPGPAPSLLPLLLGGLATVVLSPCATPLLVAVWSLAASRGGAEAVWLLGLYGLGRAVPLVLVGVSGELLQRPLARAATGWWRSWGRLAAGAAVLLLSLYFLYLGA
jgi:cytochrome c biogenesis protein CcdA